MPRLTEQEQQEIIRFLEADKPLPDLNQFVDRSIVNEVLKEMGRKPGGK